MGDICGWSSNGGGEETWPLDVHGTTDDCDAVGALETFAADSQAGTCDSAQFESCDVPLRSQRSSSLLPPMSRLRGTPSFSKKKDESYPVDSGKPFKVFVTSSSLREGLQTLRFFSVYTDISAFANYDDDASRPSGKCEFISMPSASSSSRVTRSAPRALESPVVVRFERLVRYPVVIGCLKQSGCTVSRADSSIPKAWHLYWGARWKEAGGGEGGIQRVNHAWQRVCHIPGTHLLCRKDHLSRGLRRKGYAFGPMTYLLPGDMPLLRRDVQTPGLLFIANPPASSRGRCIFLFASDTGIPADLQRRVEVALRKKQLDSGAAPGTGRARRASRGAAAADSDHDAADDSEAEEEDDELPLVQRYIDKPLLINGYKCDLRIYVACTCMEPLHVYVFNDGLVRFATEPFTMAQDSIDRLCCHLTNFSVNKKNQAFVATDDAAADGSGSKWSLRALRRYFGTQGWNWEDTWRRIERLCVQTVLTCEDRVATAVSHRISYRYSCFELYGFDVLLDETLQPHLIEVNIEPSLGCGSALDKHIKGHMIADLLTLVGIPVPPAELAEEPPATGGGTSAADRDPTGMYNMETKPSRPPKDWATLFQKSAGGFLSTISAEDKVMILRSEEELGRSGGWTRLIPTATSRDDFASGFERLKYSNAILWAWEELKREAQSRESPEQLARLTRWLRGEGPILEPKPQKPPKPTLGDGPRVPPATAAPPRVPLSERHRSRSSSLPRQVVTTAAVRNIAHVIPRPQPPAVAPLSVQTFTFIDPRTYKSS